MIYLVLSAVCLALLYGVYRLVLSRTTLHRFNRTVLLSILVLSFILPAVRIDGLSAFGGNDTIEVSPLFHAVWADENEAIGESPLLHTDDMAEAPVAAAPGAVKQAVQTMGVASKVLNISLKDVLTYLYIMGLAFFIIRLFIGIIRVETLCRLGGRRLSDGSKLVILEGEFQPSSWLNTILISRTDYETDSAAIIEHEQAHIRCHHSIDVLLTQIVCALQWFNPAAWMLKKSLTEVHEYEADAAVLSCGYNEHQYLISLVQAALRRQVGLVTSNFADCSTKKRITMMKTNQSSPFACLRALLMLPAVVVVIVFASACKQNTGTTSEPVSEQEQAAPEIVKSEPYDTVALLKKFGYDSDVDIKIKQLNHFVNIEADGSIWFNIAGQNKYERAYLSNLDEAFELAKSKCDIEVANPDKVYVMFNRDNHMDICAEVIRQLQKSYSDENIVFAQEPWVVTVPPPPGLTIDTEKDDYLIVLINANNEIHLEGKWTPAEGVKASFNSNGTISPQEIYKLDEMIRNAIPEIGEKTPPESLIVKGLKGNLQWDPTCSRRVFNEVDKIMRKYVDEKLYLYRRPRSVETVKILDIVKPK